MATGNFSLKIMVLVFKKSFLMSALCLLMRDKWGQQNVSKQKKMDRHRKGHCCLSIHLRCTWKSSMMTAHPSATGDYWASWNQTKNYLHPSCITFLLSSFVLFFFFIFLSTHFVEYFIFVSFACESVLRVCAQCWQAAKTQLSGVWEGEVEGTGYGKRAQEMVLVGKQKVTTQGND